MPKKTKSYRDWLSTKLSDPVRASRYLNAAAEDSEAMFLKALRKVALSQNRPMTEIAEACGVSREALYRMLCETGNPTSENRRAILAALGLKAIVVPVEEPQNIATIRSDASHNASAAHRKLKNNSLSGGSSTLRSTLLSGEIALSQLRKGPVRALGNLAAVGCAPETTQIGGRN